MERIGSKYGRYKHVSNEASNGVRVALMAAPYGSGYELEVKTLSKSKRACACGACCQERAL